jgi:hypothetical protein
MNLMPARPTIGSRSSFLSALAVATTLAGTALLGPSSALAESSAPALSALAKSFATAAAKPADPTLASVGADLTSKLKSLDSVLGASDAVKAQLTGTLQSLIGGKDSEALAKVFQIAQVATLTPEQKGLAKETANLAAAFVVQRNFAALEGASGDVATVVTSLRKGEIAGAVPAIQRIAKNANLTAPQKQLIGSVADQYAPGLRKAKDSLKKGLNGLQSLPGLGQ